MKKITDENPIMFDMLAQYKKSEFSSYLNFYEYCQIILQVNQTVEINDLVDHLRIESSLRENFVLGDSDDDNEL